MNNKVGKFFALFLPLLLVLMIAVVVSRYFFGVGRTDLQELTLYLHALIFLGCAGWAYLEDEHVRVDILYRNSKPQYKKLVNTLGIIFFLFPTIGVLTYYSITIWNRHFPENSRSSILEKNFNRESRETETQQLAAGS